MTLVEEFPNGVNRYRLEDTGIVLPTDPTGHSKSSPQKSGTSSEIARCSWYAAPNAAPALAQHQGTEGIMATQQQHHIVETPTEARQAERGPSVLALLLVSTGLAVLILGVVWFVFFRT